MFTEHRHPLYKGYNIPNAPRESEAQKSALSEVTCL